LTHKQIHQQIFMTAQLLWR